MRGPDWIAAVVAALPRHHPFPAVEVAGDGSAVITVIAPDRATSRPPRELPDASYRIDTSPADIRITCTEPAGLVAALRTVGCLTVDGSLACGTIEDTPAFRYRGVHLDVCRHFFTADFVKRYIDVIAALGFNVFHWHLTEDQGWRIPIDSWPQLIATGSHRTEADGSRYGGAYSRAEIADVVAHAGSLGVLVIPEIELPGHAQAAIASYRRLGCRGEPVPVWNEWGISKEVFCAGNDDVFGFLADVFDVVTDLFPSRYIHIGGDECPRDRWMECPRCRQRMQDQALADADQLQSYFVRRAARMLEGLGRTAIGWDEILEGGLPEGTVVMSWRGTDGGRAAASAGNDAIMTPLTPCYFNVTHIAHDPDDVAVSTEDVFAFDPAAGLDPRSAGRVLGGQACLWTEGIETEEKAQRMLMPRLLAMSEALWSADPARDFTEFSARARSWLRRFEESGWSVTPLDRA